MTRTTKPRWRPVDQSTRRGHDEASQLAKLRFTPSRVI